MSGLTERVIESWLTSADERSYQASFVAILLRRGEAILYVSPHSALEHGKDIVTRNSQGLLCAYQLKVGDIGTSEWRAIQGEVVEACITPFRDLKGRGSKRAKVADRVYLVLTGRVTDPVRDKISLLNEDHETRGIPAVDLVEIDDLIKDFSEVFDSFIPRTAGEASEVLRLVAADGRGPADRRSMCEFFDSIIDKAGTKKTPVRRAFADLLVASNFVCRPFSASGNYISALDVWIVATAHLVAAAQRFPESWTSDYVEIAKGALTEFSNALWTTTLTLTHVSSHRIADDFFVDARALVVAGYLGATVNFRKLSGYETYREDSNALSAWVEQPRIRFASWGEGCWGLLLNVFLGVRHTQRGVNWSRAIAEDWLEMVAPARGAPPMPGPYFTIDDWFRQQLAIGPLSPGGLDDNEEQWVSYSLESAIEFLARRSHRHAIGSRWKRISRVDRIEYIPDAPGQLVHWELVERGFLRQRPFPVTGKWSDLQHSALTKPSTFLDSFEWLLPFFLCTYPHRLSTALSARLDFLTGDLRAQDRWADSRS